MIQKQYPPEYIKSLLSKLYKSWKRADKLIDYLEVAALYTCAPGNVKKERAWWDDEFEPLYTLDWGYAHFEWEVDTDKGKYWVEARVYTDGRIECKAEERGEEK